jgi:pyridoxine 4-dehydrogenase
MGVRGCTRRNNVADTHEVLPIPGSSSPERILSNIAAQDVQLTEAEVKEIDDVLAIFTVVGDRYPEMFMKDLVS